MSIPFRRLRLEDLLVFLGSSLSVDRPERSSSSALPLESAVPLPSEDDDEDEEDEAARGEEEEEEEEDPRGEVGLSSVGVLLDRRDLDDPEDERRFLRSFFASGEVEDEEEGEEGEEEGEEEEEGCSVASESRRILPMRPRDILFFFFLVLSTALSTVATGISGRSGTSGASGVEGSSTTGSAAAGASGSVGARREGSMTPSGKL